MMLEVVICEKHTGTFDTCSALVGICFVCLYEMLTAYLHNVRPLSDL